MELNKTLLKIQDLLNERSWTLYKLAKETEIPYSSLNSLFQKNNQPTVSTLEKICAGFHISMAEFFSADTPFRPDTYDITKEERQLLTEFRSLSKRDQLLLKELLYKMHSL